MSEEAFSKEMDLSFYNMAWLIDRFVRSWSQRIRRLKEKIERKRSDEVDYIYDEVKDQAGRIILKNERPEEATIELYGARIKKRIVHKKSEKYNGADVYVEVQDEKFALVQFKLQSGNRYGFDRKQLKELGSWCSYCVQDNTRPCLCPSFIWLIDDSSGYYQKHRILKLCQVQKILGNRVSASVREFEDAGITRNSYKELLAKCWVGAPFRRRPSLQNLLEYSEVTRRLVVGFTVPGIG